MLTPELMSGVRSVLDIGGRDVNSGGRVQALLRSLGVERIEALDVRPGPGVTIVADIEAWDPFGRWDLVVTTETLEHVRYWPRILRAAAAVAPRLVGTCAGPGRAPHGCDGEAVVPDGQHYGNVSPEQVSAFLAEHYTRFAVTYEVHPLSIENDSTHDVQFWASNT